MYRTQNRWYNGPKRHILPTRIHKHQYACYMHNVGHDICNNLTVATTCTVITIAAERYYAWGVGCWN